METLYSPMLHFVHYQDLKTHEQRQNELVHADEISLREISMVNCRGRDIPQVYPKTTLGAVALD